MKKQQRFQWNSLTMGTCYYPEHWPKSIWQSDLQRMLENGISCIRIAEFAWNLIEPEEDVFTFDFFQEFLDLCEKSGMKVIFGTPTATPPAWLTEKYQEVLNCDVNGVPYYHGCRRHYNYNSSVYQHFCERIVRQIAIHYGKHPAIVGWQLDNELNCETDSFYSEADSVAFRTYLKEKFGSLEKLNEALGTTFWNQTYTDWNQIYVPRHNISNTFNPHLHLEYVRFISKSTLRFAENQACILRKYCKPTDFITTNGMFSNVNNHEFNQDVLNVYTFDSYPNFAYCVHADSNCSVNDLRDRNWSKNLTTVRGICPHFGIMEQQSGANGWTTRMEAPAPRPGQLRLWATQSVAHGADYVSFFRWRTCSYGTEMYWHGILDYDNRDNRKLKEVRQFHDDLLKINSVCGAEHVAQLAVLKDYDNEWDCVPDTWHRQILQASTQGIFAATQLNHTPYDEICIGNDISENQLSKYKVAIYPHPVMMDEKRAALLKNYVENGGTLIIGCRSGYKDLQGHCPMQAQPGLLCNLTGTTVEDFTFLSPAEEMSTVTFEGKTVSAPIFNDILKANNNAEVLAVYNSSYYAGQPALVQHRLGSGRVLHWGSTFDQDNLCALLGYCGILEPFSHLVQAPAEIELIMREKDGKRFLFALNYQPSAQTILLKAEVKSLLDGRKVCENYQLSAFGTAVFEL